MPAASTDKLIKGARRWSGQIGASGVSDASVTTIPLVSTTGLPTDTAVELAIDRVDASGNLTPAKEEIIRGVVSGTNIISAVRGVEGTAQGHSAGAVVEVRLTASMWSRMIDALLVSINQAGQLLQSAVDGIRYAADAGGDDTYEVTLDPVPAAYYAGMEVNFKPSTANTGACTLNVNGLGTKTIKKNVSSDLATGDILSGQMVKVIYDGTNFQLVSSIPASVLNAPRGFMINGKFTVTDTGSGITIALKTLAGADPSASDPVYIRIGDTVRSVTGALSRTIADGTNWCNAGSSELATKEIDWALYAVWDSNSSSVALSPSRIFHGNLVSDFSATTTNEKHLIGYSDYTTTDEVEVIGRFAATLSAGAGYTWSVPTYDANNLIQKPIYETRWLSWQPAYSGAGAMTWTSVTTTTARYKVLGGVVFLELDATGTIGGTLNVAIYTTLPFTFLDIALGIGAVDGAQHAGFGRLNATNSLECYKYNSANWTAGGSRGVRYNTFGEIN